MDPTAFTKKHTNSFVFGLALMLLTVPLDSNGQTRAARQTERKIVLPKTDLKDDAQILHVMNRLAFGPRAGDLEKLRTIGLAAYLDQQLHPEGKPDPAVTEKLQALETLQMTSWELLGKYPDPNMLRQMQQRQNARPGQNPNTMPPNPDSPRPQDPSMRPTGEPPNPEMAGNPQKPPAGPPSLATMNGPQRVVQELVAAKVLRAVYSEWQLNEVLVDFWMNHFNVFIQKDAERWMVTEYERDVIRPHAWGKFNDLLLAVAQSPAMLMYLDNFQSADPTPPQPMFKPVRPYDGQSLARLPQPGQRNRGLNENYGRELLELHTLGVDGGYSQKDVVDVARCFTGWTIIPPQQGGGSVFLSALHDRGEKVVLGHRIPPGGGIEDGMKVLEILAHHPSTARFLATKLVRHLVSDDPPENLVLRVAKTYTDTDGDIREMLRSILISPEFFSTRYAATKFKRPFEFLVSALRTLDAEVTATPAFFGLLQTMGEPPYSCQPPTGYSDSADEWLSTNQLLRRMNTGVALASGRTPGVRVDLEKLFADPVTTDAGAIVDRWAGIFLGRQLSEDSRRKIVEQISQIPNPQAMRMLAAAILLGSPEFQRR